MPALPHERDTRQWDDLVDRLAVYDVQYLTGGSAWDGRCSRYHTPGDAPLDSLIIDLAHAPQARLRNALVALLLRHPEHASVAATVAHALPRGDRARLIILTSYLAAAALQQAWTFTLDIYLPGHALINADDIATELDVPRPNEDYGRPSLRAASSLVVRDQAFPFDYVREWENVAELVLTDLRLQEHMKQAKDADHGT